VCEGVKADSVRLREKVTFRKEREADGHPGGPQNDEQLQIPRRCAPRNDKYVKVDFL
jgi:hypothetical protein